MNKLSTPIFVISLLLMIACKSSTRVPDSRLSCNCTLSGVAPKFDGVDVVDAYFNSNFDIDIIKVYSLNGSVLFNSSRLFRDSVTWYFQNNKKRETASVSDVANFNERIVQIRRSQHVKAVCDNRSSNSDLYIYLFSKEGKLVQSLIADVPLERIGQSNINDQNIVDVLAAFGWFEDVVTKINNK